MKIRKVAEYEATCIGCGAKVRIMAEEVDFSRGFADQNIPCPICDHNISVLKDGFVPETLVPKIYKSSWEGVEHGRPEISGT